MLSQELPHGMDLLLLAFSTALAHYRRASGKWACHPHRQPEPKGPQACSTAACMGSKRTAQAYMWPSNTVLRLRGQQQRSMHACMHRSCPRHVPQREAPATR